MTLDEAYLRFQDALHARNYAPSTRSNYRHGVEGFLAWLGEGAGTRPVTSVTRGTIEGYQAHLAERGLAKATQAVRVRALKRWFEWLVDRGFLFESPTRGIVETPRGMRQLPAVLTEGEIERMLSTPNTATKDGLRDRAILELLYATGIRRGELVALDLGDLDLDRGLCHVRSGKGRKGRVVPFGASAKRWLRLYLREARPRYEKKPSRVRAVFLGRFGDRLAGPRVHQIVRRVAEEAGVTRKADVHAFRHAFATHLVRAGADIVTVQRLLGHSSPGVTSQVYTRVAPREVKETHARTHPGEVGAPAGEGWDA